MTIEEIRRHKVTTQNRISERCTAILREELDWFYKATGFPLSAVEFGTVDVTKHGDQGRMFVVDCRMKIEV